MKENAKKKILKSPEETFEQLKKYFNSDRKFILLLTFILGIITHFLLFSNLILSQDGLLNFIHYTAGGYEASLGRWGINFFDSLRNNIGMPFITTFISIVLMGFINILIIELFEIKGKLAKILTVLSVVVSPSLCMTLLYAYTADAYLYAMLFSVLTVYLFYKTKNKKIGTILGMICFIIMLSTYQSYMGMTVGLILMLSIRRLLVEENSSWKVIKDLFCKGIILVVSAVIYAGITMLILKANNTSMAAYKGADEIGLISILSSLIPSIKNAYIGFFKYFFADGIILNRAWSRDKLYLIFFVLSAIVTFIFLIKTIKKDGIHKDIFTRIGLSIILILLLPIALNLISVIAVGNEIYYLIATQMLLIIPFILMIVELLDSKTTLENILNWGIVIILSIIMFTYFLSIVVTYQTAELSYNQARAISNRVIERMEECPGYRAGMNKLFAGVIDDSNFPKTLDIYNYAVTNSLRASIFHGTYWGQEGTWKSFMNAFCGTHINFCTDYEYYVITNSDEFKKMDLFPGENSVKIINDVMVVKFCDEPALPPISQNMQENGIFSY